MDDLYFQICIRNIMSVYVIFCKRIREIKLYKIERLEFMKIIIKIEQGIMRLGSYILPKKFLKKMVVDTDNNAVSRILTTKEIRRINENMLDTVNESKAIVFEESCNDFSVFM